MHTTKNLKIENMSLIHFFFNKNKTFDKLKNQIKELTLNPKQWKAIVMLDYDDKLIIIYSNFANIVMEVNTPNYHDIVKRIKKTKYNRMLVKVSKM